MQTRIATDYRKVQHDNISMVKMKLEWHVDLKGPTRQSTINRTNST
jgi:hypothetical protein